MDKKFMVSYEIEYVHRVSVGITAANPHQAQQLAEQAFNVGTIWDNTKTMPLLSDDYHEFEEERLDWECVEVNDFPEPDNSVLQINREQAAFRVCRGLLEAFERAEVEGGVISSEDLDKLLTWAKQAMPGKA